MHDPEPFELDKAHVRSSFERAAQDYDRVAVLQREVGDRLLERLDLLRIEPACVVDLGTGTGYIARALLKRYAGARVFALDIAQAMLQQARSQSAWWRKPRWVCGDIERLPFRDQSVDLLLSNLTLQWCNGVQAAFAEFQRVLKPGAPLLFTSFGPDTLHELRSSWAAADNYSHVNRFLDMHDIGDALLQAGLSEPVLDMECITLTYADVQGLVRDLKMLGAHNLTYARARGLTGRGRWQTMATHYESYRQAGRLPATYEVIYGHAWAGTRSPAVRSDEAVVPLSALRRPGPHG